MSPRQTSIAIVAVLGIVSSSFVLLSKPSELEVTATVNATIDSYVYAPLVISKPIVTGSRIPSYEVEKCFNRGIEGLVGKSISNPQVQSRLRNVKVFVVNSICNLGVWSEDFDFGILVDKEGRIKFIACY